MIQHFLYTAEQTRQLDALTIQSGTSGIELMERAGQAAFNLIKSYWPQVHTLHIVCGNGNNAGDGFVIARLAKQAGLHIYVHSIGDTASLNNEALLAYQSMQAANIHTSALIATVGSTNTLIIDALLGTGLNRDVDGAYAQAISWINQEHCPVLSIDIPSGLSANTGNILGHAVKADATLSYIGKNIGLYQGEAKTICGDIFFSSLEIDEKIYSQLKPTAQLLNAKQLRESIKPRHSNTHKGHYGHVLVIGGNYGFAGAALMAAEAALRMGTGLVSIATRPEHISAIIARRPEIMAHGINDAAGQAMNLIAQASHIIVGPGLGQDEWAQSLLQLALDSNKPCLLDADALNLISSNPKVVASRQSNSNSDWIITPHPGEAARLLSTSNASIQSQRLVSAEQLSERFNAVSLLKGAGSLICNQQTIFLCEQGNAHMASGGMGDVLSGIITGLWAQGLNASEACSLGVYLHAQAADNLVDQGKGMGLIATDLIDEIRVLLNA